ncbi:MAG: HAMP domain-containing histidine kinase [Planctomycetes bacterium]|nr:HAMP domain-containing histidine kinase [Planctomycetota bacterium]
MRRGRRVWLGYALAALLVLAAMLQVSRVLVGAARAKHRAEALRQRQDRERLALWQLDFSLAPMVAFETGRAIAVEAGFDPEGLADGGFGRLRFAWRRDGRLRLEQPDGGHGDWCLPADLGAGPGELVAALVLPDRPEALVAASSVLVDLGDPWLRNGASIPVEDNTAYNDLPGRQLQQSRANALNPMSNFANVVPGLPRASIEPFGAVWLDRRDGGPGELALVRRAAEPEVFQFVLLDRERLEAWLTAELSEVLPGVELRPQREPARPGESVLATLPIRLQAPPLADEGGALDPSFLTTLGIAWAAVALALLTTAFVLRAATSLSERRARFVSTVTHELRTPLTTFRMYAQMLARGMVPDEGRRQTYLATLEEESERLARVVESVLLYARLEEGRAQARREELSLAELGDRLLVPLGRAVQAADMELDFDLGDDVDRRLLVDVQTVEQILVNLADNAAKYGRGEEALLQVRLVLEGDQLQLLVTDRGPGVPVAERRAIFEPFRRARAQEAGAAPGVGLGLALARGLARAQGGDLELLPSPRGACFRLRLPIA